MGSVAGVSGVGPPKRQLPSLGCGYAVCVALGLAGFGLLTVAQRNFAVGKTMEGWIAGILGGAMAIGALALLGPMQRAVADAKERERRRRARPDSPWTWDPRWTEADGIAQSPGRHAGPLLGFAVIALVLSSPIWFLLPREIERGNQAAWLGLVFPLFGSWVLARAGLAAWRRRKFGPARFIAAELPIALQGEAVGMVLVPRAVMPTGPGRVSLTCWSTAITRSGGRTRQSETALAHAEREVPADAWEKVPGESRLMVRVPARSGLASTCDPATAEAPAVEWRLKVEMPTAGADFVAEFVLPVFPVAAAGGVAGRASPPAEVRAAAWRVAGLAETDQPGALRGQALGVAAGLGRRHVAGSLLAAGAIGGIAGLLAQAGIPVVFPLFFGVFAVLPLLAALALWRGGGERVWVESGTLCVERRGSLARIPIADVLRVETRRDVAVGEHQYLRVVAVLRPPAGRRFPRRVPLLTMLRGDEAATEAIAWLEERLTDRKA